ncbi:M13 family metallopeptidase [Lentilactobacillus hilgardii]|uniref:M13 family metallopeptidase n=1 Tax=Lentilactobacillus hilgardii TaxID=1588 RepID=UPI0021A2C3D8|nr:M13-type metalloendopeptidase [Lentilactobacillus hilgardii]MCT3400820.1 M13 family peptidase [Lentilactobacillus hilgardii]
MNIRQGGISLKKLIVKATEAEGGDANQPTNDSIDKSLLKDDLYQAVNGRWEKTAKIPADHSSTGGFMDLNDNIDKELMHDLDDLKAKNKDSFEAPFSEMLKLYELAQNFKKRDADGADPLKPYLEKIENISNFADLNGQLADWVKTGFPLPFGFFVEPDMKNTQVNALFANSPSLFLPDRTYYENNNPAYDQLMPVLTKTLSQLLVLADYSSNEADEIVESAKKFDAAIAPHVKSAEESADYSKMYNPQKFSEFAKSSSHFDLTKLADGLFGKTPEQIIVTEPKYFEALDEIVNEDSFQDMKNWMLVGTIYSATGYLSEEFRQTGSTFSRALSGKKEATPQKKSAFYLATGTFGQTIGDYYAKKYFGPKAKADVEHMVRNMISVYKNRLQNNTWLGEDTRKKAIVKLNKLGLHVGYPDHIDQLEYKYKVTPENEGGNLFNNMTRIGQVALADNYAKLGQPVDRTKWEMSASTVNAYYDPFKNLIVFPAAILQAPFYSLDQTSSQNYGGIGAVMAHEISHAFDNNGSLFDEMGNLNNWWTKEDHEYFTKLADKMIKEFDGIPFAGGKVNGKLTVSENIADAGGLSCANEAAKNEQDYNLYDFFINWAKVWRMKATTQYKQLLLNIDVHAPAELRANVQVKNLDDFYSTFEVKSGDGMYLKPEDRVKIW